MVTPVEVLGITDRPGGVAGSDGAGVAFVDPSCWAAVGVLSPPVTPFEVAGAAVSGPLAVAEVSGTVGGTETAAEDGVKGLYMLGDVLPRPEERGGTGAGLRPSEAEVGVVGKRWSLGARGDVSRKERMLGSSQRSRRFRTSRMKASICSVLQEERGSGRGPRVRERALAEGGRLRQGRRTRVTDSAASPLHNSTGLGIDLQPAAQPLTIDR